MRPMMHSPFEHAFIAGTRLYDEREPVEMRTCIVGDLALPTGRVCVADPYVTDFEQPSSPFARTAPTGSFPVELAIARFPRGDERVACARVRFADARAVRWEHAHFEGTTAPGPDEIAGYGVDAGTGCFFDASVRGVVDEAVGEAWMAASEARYVDTWSWHVAPLGAGNVVLFSSGWGDGFYGSHWGFAEDGALVELVTEFAVLIRSVRERIELPTPLARGRIEHTLLAAHDVTARVPWLSRTTVIVGGRGGCHVELSDGTPVTMQWVGGERKYTWKKASPGARVVLSVTVGRAPLAPAG